MINKIKQSWKNYLMILLLLSSTLVSPLHVIAQAGDAILEQSEALVDETLVASQEEVVSQDFLSSETELEEVLSSTSEEELSDDNLTESDNPVRGPDEVIGEVISQSVQYGDAFLTVSELQTSSDGNAIAYFEWSVSDAAELHANDQMRFNLPSGSQLAYFEAMPIVFDGQQVATAWADVEANQVNVTFSEAIEAVTGAYSGNLSVPVTMQAVTRAAQAVDYGSQFISFSQLQDADGNPSESFGQFDTMKAYFEWQIPNEVEIFQGDTMKVTLPTALRLATDLSFDVTDANGAKVGEAFADSQTGKITIVFTDYFESHKHNKSGNLNVYTNWEQSQIEVDRPFELNWPSDVQTVTVNYDGPTSNEIFNKFGWVNSKDPSIMEWRIRVNLAEESLNNVVLTDVIGPNQVLIAESLRADYGSFDTSQAGAPLLVTGAVPSELFTNIHDSGFTLNLGQIDQAVLVYYSTQTSDNGASTQYSNSAYLTGDDLNRELIDIQTPHSGGGGSGQGDQVTAVTVNKQWLDANNQDGLRPDQIEVQLLLDGQAILGPVVLNEANLWTYVWENLEKSSLYSVVEVGKIEGYTAEVISIGSGEFTIENLHLPETIDITGTKTWEDQANQDGLRPEAITVHLLADGVKIAEAVATAAADWTYSFNNLPKYEAGTLIDYQIEEVAVAHYTSSVDGYNLINRYTPEETSVSVTKVWQDGENQDGLRPETIEVQLTANGQVVGETVILSEDTQWFYEWTGLPMMAAGKQISYQVIEVSQVAGYSSELVVDDAKQFTLINSHKPETIEISGSKTWQDADDQDGLRPETITVNLLADGVKVSEQVVGAESDWAYSFTELAKYADGQEVVYTVTENHVADYTTEINGYDLVNHYTPGKMSVTVTKVWDDKNNQDGLRADSIEVQLMAAGQAVGDVVSLDESVQWTYTWTDLPLMNNGEEVLYEVIELSEVVSYTSQITSSNKGNILITNYHVPETTEVSGTKTWQDSDDQDGLRPDTITVNLLADGIEVAEQVVSTESDWAYSFTELAKYADGKEIMYTVTENHVADYTTEINGYDLVNHYTPGKTSVTVTKTWDDKQDQDGLRPTQIEVQLTADGVAAGESVILNDANAWTHTWVDLSLKESGREIVYSVEELTVIDGYQVSINQADKGNIILMNSYVPQLVAVEGTKTWEDNKDQAGLRPSSITVNLWADGMKVASQKVTAATQWQYEFSDLPKYTFGEPINYSITETAVENYQTIVDGYNLTNKLLPQPEVPTKTLPSTGERSWTYIALVLLLSGLGLVLLFKREGWVKSK